MAKTDRTFLPAAQHDLFLPLYDSFVSWMGFGRAYHDLLEQADISTNDQILDIGCGTGTLAVQIKRQYPTVQVSGIDPDPKALRRAKEKARQAEVPVKFEQGFADELPYEASTFDRVFSSFMFHHLERPEREKTSREVLRVLKPGGSFHLVDFVDHGTQGWWRRIVSAHAHLRENSDDRILEILTRAGLTPAVKLKDSKMVCGLFHLAFYEASKLAPS